MPYEPHRVTEEEVERVMAALPPKAFGEKLMTYSGKDFKLAPKWEEVIILISILSLY